MSEWFNRTAQDVVRELESDAAKGLSTAEAGQRLAKHGPNRLTEQGGRNPLRILFEQFTSLMVLLLIGAALVSGVLLHEVEDAVVILVVVVLNAILGFRQEYKAEQAMAALKRLTVPRVRVRRDGEVREVASVEIVPGDIVLFEAGNVVPADCRLVDEANLRIQESALTGEAVAVEKHTDPLEGSDLPVGDRSNMAYMGTVVTYGRGTGVVTGTGMQTELGDIANLIQQAEDEDTVLQRKLNHLSKVLVAGALILVGVVSVEAWLVQKMALKEIFMTAVSMAVAAVPEGLPAVVTISLALGAQRMLKRNALIRELPAVETLGSVTCICSDKTGTLTQNRMTVRHLSLPGTPRELNEDESRAGGLAEHVLENGGAGLTIAAACLCSDAVVRHDGEGQGGGEIVGDPTEGALVVAAEWAGWRKEELEKLLPRVDERPFDSDRKRMTTVHALQGDAGDLPPCLEGALARLGCGTDSRIAFTKGAAASVLERADRIWHDGAASELTEDWKDRILAENERLAKDGIRVLAVAMHDMAEGEAQEPEESLVYVGMVGMLDPLRSEVPPAVETCHGAGIRPIMITGDHPLIARYIGGELGLHSPGGHLTGKELAGMDRQTLESKVSDVSIYARVSPEHKLRIVDALQKNGHIVAMTGDGVNDAPALKEADIGVAMGITGTDVSREASDMVLRDDNFATIVEAVKQGRIIFDNIIRFVRFILASNWAEILVMLLSPLFRMPLPLFPVQILWMNLVTDGLPALALGVEPGEPGIMKRRPRPPAAPIIDGRMGRHILLVGGVMAVLALCVGYLHFDGEMPVHGHGGDPSTWRTMLFTVMVFSQLALALAERSDEESLWRVGVFSNRYMTGALALTFCLQLAVIYVPVLGKLFKTTPLSAAQLAICAGVGSLMLVLVELKKLIGRVKRPPTD